MERAGLDALLAGGRASYRYLTGHRSVQFAIDKRPMLVLLPLVGPPARLVYGAEVAEAAAQSWIEDVRGYPGRSPLEAGLVADLLSGLGLGEATIGWELGPGQRPALPHSTFEEVRRHLPGARFVDGSAVLDACRLVKSDAEVLRVEEACRVACRGHRLALERMRPGLSVAECERLVLAAMLEAGTDADPPPVLFFGGAAQAHVYAEGEVLQLDFAVSLRGYRADLTRRASFGAPGALHLRDH
ncbi:MAG: aminopeptidase P family N-terminal domain-containing protein, partial [Candidatus Dormibacterales bacterium]